MLSPMTTIEVRAHSSSEGAALLRVPAQQLRGRWCCWWRRL